MRNKLVRTATGLALLLAGLPMLFAGGVLWFATQHQSPGGGFTAPLSTVTTDGYAVVVPDVDELLREDAPFTRGGRTTLRLDAQTGERAVFLGLAPAGEVEAYLDGAPHTRVDEVRLARGALPVATSAAPGDAAPAGPPAAQPFWVRSGVGTLQWSPHEWRGEDLSLVVMGRDAQAPLTAEMDVRLSPQWLTPTTVGALVLGALLLAAAVAVLSWPSRPPREIVYVVPPAQVPEFAAQLGIPVPSSVQTAQAQQRDTANAGDVDDAVGSGVGDAVDDTDAPTVGTGGGGAGSAHSGGAGGRRVSQNGRVSGDEPVSGYRPVSASPLMMEAAPAGLAGKRPAGTARLLAAPAAWRDLDRDGAPREDNVPQAEARRPVAAEGRRRAASGCTQRRPETLEDLPAPPPQWPLPEETRPTSAPTPVSTWQP